MSTESVPAHVPPDVLAELQAIADSAASGARDPEVMRQAGADMDRIREEIRQKHGVLDIGGPAIRTLRDT